MLSIYLAMIRRHLVVQFQYRVAMAIWLIGMVLEPVVYLVVWSTVAREQGGSVAGYSSADFAAYFIVLMAVNHVTFTWIMWEFEYRLRTGTLSALLLRPMHPIHDDLAENMAYKLLTFVVMVPTAIVLIYVFQARLAIPPWAAGMFVPALLLSFGIRFILGYCIAAAAFWTTRVQAVNDAYFVVMAFLSGQLAPLAVMPPWVQTLANWLPMRWAVSFPVELLLGRVSYEAAWQGLGMQVFWLVIMSGVLVLVWRAGVKRHSAVGA